MNARDVARKLDKERLASDGRTISAAATFTAADHQPE
jgi:hypothetical protein